MTRAPRLLPFLFLALAGPAAAAPRCGPHAEITAHLAERYGESRRAIALDGKRRVVEIYASDDGSWSLLTTKPGGPTCLMAAGEAFEALAGGLSPPEPEA
ncbi:hypothetical protein [Limimaricola pyoseonensis]|uniref:Uncharacterized protein n=1 Tax=Limimaricola pyoseonensis TaxID=521013 RepID=A0A1G7C486_9RHOB|nr:hypothetical protein [Limimaricola pyoseonensis]SDE34063.1 hypothetical protein SAMN04488567_1348 [Limimaricola pyoseonensis]